MAANRTTISGVLSSTKKSWRLIALLMMTILVFFFILYSCHATNSLVLTSFLYLTLFDVTSLLSCFVAKWINVQKPNHLYSYGFERGNVLAIFSSSIVVVLAAMTIVKHSMERLFDPPVINTEGMILPLCFGVIAHFMATNLVTNKPLKSATEGARSNFIQNALSDVGYSICGVSPVLGRFLMRRMNPLALLVGVSTCVVFITKFLVEYEDLHVADVIATFFISALVCGTLLPLSMYCGKILLQTTPESLIPLLDKSLKEVSTLDGVLECKNEHFWLISFGTLTGSLHVRVRRDANEQEVLQKVTTLMAPHIAHLTVQVTKDDWSLPLSPIAAKLPSHSPPSHATFPGPKVVQSIPGQLPNVGAATTVSLNTQSPVTFTSSILSKSDKEWGGGPGGSDPSHHPHTSPAANQGQVYSHTPPMFGYNRYQAPQTRGHTQSQAPPTHGQTHSYTPPTYGQAHSYTPPTHGQAHSYTPPTHGHTHFYTPPTHGHTHFYTPPTHGHTHSHTQPTYSYTHPQTLPAYGQSSYQAPPTHDHTHSYVPPTSVPLSAKNESHPSEHQPFQI